MPDIVDDDEMRVSLEEDHLRHASVLLDDGEVVVERVDTGSADWDYIRDHMRARRVESHRLLETDR